LERDHDSKVIALQEIGVLRQVAPDRPAFAGTMERVTNEP
jgi:hypothetical protein